MRPNPWARGAVQLLFPGALTIAAACVLDPIDASGRPCPCAMDFVCVDGRCVAPAAAEQPDAGRQRGADAGADAAEPGIDAGTRVDAGPRLDAGLLEAGREELDAGPVVDAGQPLSECRTGGSLGATAFCDGFENPGLHGWVRQLGFGSVTAVPAEDDVQPYLGRLMLRAQIDRTSSWAELFNCPFRPGGSCPATVAEAEPGETVTSGDVYMRAYVYVPAGVDIGDVSLLHIGMHRGFDEPPAGFNIDGNAAAMYIGAAPKWLPEDDDSGAPWPFGQWVCVESHLVVADVDGSASTSIDGQVVVEGDGFDTRPEEPYLRFGVGVGWSGDNQAPLRVYFDEVAISRTPIGC